MTKATKQNIHGVVLLDKPAGISSNRALQKARGLFQAKKAGHTGSLDPLATGLLPLCFGQATKVCEYFLNSSKRYQTVVKLGEVTDTWDQDGEIIERYPVMVEDKQIEQALNQFRGKIKQVPPMHSALKKDGQPLYKLARKGQVIDRPARDMQVFELNCERLDENHLQLDVHCSSGFYIRSLAYDLGKVLGCGAHVSKLRRTQIKQITLSQALTLDELSNSDDVMQYLLPIDSLLQEMPSITLNEQQVRDLSFGKNTPADGLNTDGISRFYTPDQQLLAVGEVTENGLLKTHKSFIDALKKT